MTRWEASRPPSRPQPQTERPLTPPTPGGGGPIQASKPIRAGERGSGEEIGKKGKTKIMENRKQLLPFPSSSLPHQNTPSRDGTKQPAVAIITFRRTHDIPPQPIRRKQTSITDHPPSISAPPALVRSASLPVPLVEERGETTRKASNRPPPRRHTDETSGTGNEPPASPPQRNAQARR